jgi:hypothetical protein
MKSFKLSPDGNDNGGIADPAVVAQADEAVKAAEKAEADAKAADATAQEQQAAEGRLKEATNRRDVALTKKRFMIDPNPDKKSGPVVQAGAVEVTTNGTGYTDNPGVAHALLQQGFVVFDQKNKKPYQDVLESKTEATDKK